MSTAISIVVTVIVILLIIGLIFIYNKLATKRILVQEGFSGIGTCLQERNDLIPNLVETVKGYAGHENQTLTEVIKWRNQSAAATTVEEQNEATKGLKQSMMNLQVVTENYPELKADTHFHELMKDLSRIEDKINDSRRYYNGTVREYNQVVAVFPSNIVAGVFGYKPAVFFAEDAVAKTAPKVKFQ